MDVDVINVRCNKVLKFWMDVLKDERDIDM